jgi:hypothetical protein
MVPPRSLQPSTSRPSLSALQTRSGRGGRPRREQHAYVHGCHALPQTTSRGHSVLSVDHNHLPEDRRLQSASFPMDQDGRTYHVGTRVGEVSNRILGVGSSGRARLLGSLLSPLPGV